MSEMKHTPGPWTVLEGSAGMIYTVGSPYGHGPMHVADTRGWGHLTGRGACAMDDGPAAGIQDANAALIAAAPELLRALKACREAFLALPDGWAEALPASVTPAILKAEGSR